MAARRQREDDLDAAIGAWERRLSPLAEAVTPVRPPAGLFPKIEARLADAAGPRWTGQSRRAGTARAALAQPGRRCFGGGACLLVVIGVREMVRPQAPSSYVAVFQKDDVSPAFLLSVDLKRGCCRSAWWRPSGSPGKPINCGSPPSDALGEDAAMDGATSNPGAHRSWGERLIVLVPYLWLRVSSSSRS